MKQIALALISAIALLPLAAKAQEQNATVTFYAQDHLGLGRAVLTAGISSDAPAKVPPFYLFDGDTKIAKWKGNRFLTIALAAGEHTFAGVWKEKNLKHNRGYSLTPVRYNLEAGKHYFLRMTGHRKGVYIVQVYWIEMDEVTCAEARINSGKLKLLEPKHTFVPVDSATFPDCQN